MSEEKLSEFLKTGKDWLRMRTSVPSVFVVKLPPYRSSPARLVVELNPLDETGTPKKRRGLILRSNAEFGEFKKLFSEAKLPKLLSMIDSINPQFEVGKRKKEEVIEL